MANVTCRKLGPPLLGAMGTCSHKLRTCLGNGPHSYSHRPVGCNLAKSPLNRLPTNLSFHLLASPAPASRRSGDPLVVISQLIEHACEHHRSVGLAGPVSNRIGGVRMTFRVTVCSVERQAQDNANSGTPGIGA
ncbi:hypothetical protein ZHAS_00022117 [Anopheles sinensis]|uniref:Uncharacterized protein n=1 Tax=Anopheles sinensis TaxID=74873 RepID=A0A084WU44_ANOSI|nr:hypothetical protein ZHAS_00022117 [Anopheles sinensis]